MPDRDDDEGLARLYLVRRPLAAWSGDRACSWALAHEVPGGCATAARLSSRWPRFGSRGADTSTAAVDTAVRILDAAEQLVRERGFNGFSYANVAAELGLTSASVHYH